jgi:DNA-binding protein Fis
MITLKIMNSPTVREQVSIEFILEEASRYFLRKEVQETARKILEELPGINVLTAYEMAYSEWVK